MRLNMKRPISPPGEESSIFPAPVALRSPVRCSCWPSSKLLAVHAAKYGPAGAVQVITVGGGGS